MKSLPPWGIALEALRHRAGFTLRDIGRTVMGQGDWYKLCRRPRGPTVVRLDKILAAFGMTWMDWAEEYEGARPRLPRLRRHR